MRKSDITSVAKALSVEGRDMERMKLEKEMGEVWDTRQLMTEFKVLSFLAPYVVVIRLSDGAKGTLRFQNMPRFYHSFVEALPQL